MFEDNNGNPSSKVANKPSSKSFINFLCSIIYNSSSLGVIPNFPQSMSLCINSLQATN